MDTRRFPKTVGCVGIVMLCGIWSSAHAEGAGSTVVSMGWAHIDPQSGSDPLTVTGIAGNPVHMEIGGSGAAARNGDTGGIAFEHYLTDNIGAALVGGWPGNLQLEGQGTLASYGVIGKARPWSPQFLLRYHFNSAHSDIRPFVGIGVNYFWMTDQKITNSRFVTENFGPGGSAKVETSSSWNPVYQIGVDYKISDRWSAGVAVSYIPVDTKVKLTGRTAAGTEIISQTTVRLRPITTFFNLSYSF